MASKSAERCKIWREKRKDDAGYRERERQRKRDARRKRTAEGKQHDRILGKTRQRKFRENAKKKTLSKDSDLLEKVDEANENIIKVDTGNDEVNNDTENIEEIHFAGNSDTYEDIQIIIGNVDVTRHMSTRPDNVAPVQLSESNEMELYSFSISNSKDINAFPERSIWSKMDDADCHAILQNVNTNRPSLKENTLSITEEESSIRDQNADRRKAYFQALQTALLRIEDFDSIKSHCSSYSQHIDKTYPIEDLPVLDGSTYLTDLAALSLYPHGDAPDSYVPIQTFGDGNCLPRVGSLFAFGNEEHHVEIRVRIFMELCRFEDTYLDNSFLNRGMSVPSDNIAIAYASYSDVFVPLEKDKCRFAYRQYVKNILKTNSFNSMWSIFALASILGVQICSIYPSYGGFNVRDHLHRQVMPRILRHNNRTIHIMWTSTQGKRNSPITWTPNHFVAVLPTHDAFPFGYGLDVAGSSSQTQTMRMQMDTHQHGSHTQEGISDGVSKIVQKDENVDSPTSALLQFAELESSTIHVTETATGGGEGIADRSGADNSLRQDKERLDSIYETFEDKRRQGDMCSVHPTEELVYFCSTCNDLPICYKCHLQTHQRHDLADLKVHLVDMEERYLREVTTAHEKLMRDVNQRKRAHEDDSQQIKRKIKEMETFYKQQVETWTRNQTDIVNTRDKAMESKLEYFIVQSKNSEKIAKRKVSELRSLPISQRVLALCAESEQTMLTDICPRTQKMTFSTEPFNILEHLGTITEIVNENTSKNAENELVQTERDCCGGSIVTNNYQQKGLRNDNGSKLPDKSTGAIGVGDCRETVSLSSHPDTDWFNEFLMMSRDIGDDLLFSSDDNYDSDASNSSDEEKVDHFINRAGPSHNATDRHLVTMQTDAISDYTINHEFEKPDEVSYISCDYGLVVRKTYRLPLDTSERRRTVCDTLYRQVTTHRQTTGTTGERITLDTWSCKFILLSSVTCPEVVRLRSNSLICSNYDRYLYHFSKEGQLYPNINTDRHLVSIGVSSLDQSVWYTPLEFQREVKRIATTGEDELMFSTKYEIEAVCPTVTGHVLIFHRYTNGGDDTKHSLTMYTYNGDVVQSTDVDINKDIYINTGRCIIRECLYKRGIALLYNHLFLIYDSSLEFKHKIETLEYYDNINDVCFDRRGHILLCFNGRVDMMDQRTGQYIRTVVKISAGTSVLSSCDIDDDGVLWLLNKELISLCSAQVIATHI